MGAIALGMPHGDQPHPVLPWISRIALAAARAARRPAGPHARPGESDNSGVREVLLAHHPALPFTMISEAVAYILATE